VNSICPELSENELNFFAEKRTIKTLAKKDVFMSSGQIQNEIGFIIKGLIRSFFVDQNSNEKTVRFYPENDYATHYTSFITQQPSKYTFQCLEETTKVSLSYNHIQLTYK